MTLVSMKGQKAETLLLEEGGNFVPEELGKRICESSWEFWERNSFVRVTPPFFHLGKLFAPSPSLSLKVRFKFKELHYIFSSLLFSPILFGQHSKNLMSIINLFRFPWKFLFIPHVIWFDMPITRTATCNKWIFFPEE